MAQEDTPVAREALARVLAQTTDLFDALLSPFDHPSRVPPDAAIGRPVRVPFKTSRSAVRPIADELTRGGLNAWHLYQVAERESQVRKFVSDYRKGLYRSTASAIWVGMVRRFRDAILTDIHTAQQAPRGWDRRVLGTKAAGREAPQQDLLTPRDVAPELKMGERSIRRKIQEGTLGPWRKDGSRWVIGRDEFMRFWAARLLDSDMPRPPES